MNSEVIVTEKNVIEDVVRKVIREENEQHVPEVVRKATESPYMTKEEILDMTGWSSRTLQNLRDTNQITYVKHGRKILYPRQPFYEFLEAHKIEPTK